MGPKCNHKRPYERRSKRTQAKDEAICPQRQSGSHVNKSQGMMAATGRGGEQCPRVLEPPGVVQPR